MSTRFERFCELFSRPAKRFSCAPNGISDGESRKTPGTWDVFTPFVGSVGSTRVDTATTPATRLTSPST